MKLKQMKLFRKRTLQQTSFFKKHYMLLLWLSPSLYLFYFSSCSSPNPSIKITTLQKLSTSQVLIQQKTTIQKQPTSVKIYIYDLPSRYNKDWLSNPRCGSHLFAAEVAIHEALLTSEFRTTNPSEADFFFVPVYVSCNFSTVNGFPSLTNARSLLSSSTHHISSNLQFWNRTQGRDHIFVASHDYGACFHAMEDVAIAHKIPDFLKNSILLQTFGVISPHPCQEAEHILIPPYISPEILQTLVKPPARRDIYVFFRGKMEIHPKNISGRFYSRKVRTQIWNKFVSNKRFYLKRKRYEGYRAEINRSVFCLCPLGWAPWSPRPVESVALGCVPVILADGIRLPFPGAVDWPSISLTVPERDVGKLEEILDDVAATNLSVIQKNLWDPRMRKALIFNRRMEEGDATWQMIRGLEGKIGRSWRRMEE